MRTIQSRKYLTRKTKPHIEARSEVEQQQQNTGDNTEQTKPWRKKQVNQNHCRRESDTVSHVTFFGTIYLLSQSWRRHTHTERPKIFTHTILCTRMLCWVGAKPVVQILLQFLAHSRFGFYAPILGRPSSTVTKRYFVVMLVDLIKLHCFFYLFRFNSLWLKRISMMFSASW